MLVHCFFLFLVGQVSCISANNFFEEDVINKIVFPSLGEENSLCRNHSKFYLEELGKMKLWATEMYDASAKFPSGVLYGSPYAFGQFDECLDIKVPYENHHFAGKYCMAKIVVTPNFKYKSKEIDFEIDDYEEFYNVSAWSKMLAYNKNSKASRNEILFSICLPSSCLERDLLTSLETISNHINDGQNDFNLTIEMQNNCQVKSEYVYSTGDKVFIMFISFIIGIAIICSFYDYFSGNEDSMLGKAPGKLHDVFICFSILKNFQKLTTLTDSEDGLNCLSGIKVISMFCIILGHRCMFSLGAPLINPPIVEKIYSKLLMTPITNGTIIVDLFFLISGFLACYFALIFVKSRKMNVFHVILMYFHRIIRLFPAYAVVIAFYCTVFASLGNGPFWQERVGVEKDRCLKSWWTNLLYINNYVNVDNMCMFQSWFLTCDMHYFLLVPLLVILLKKHPTCGVFTIIALIISSIMFVCISVYTNNEKAILLVYLKFLRDPLTNKTFRDIYTRSHFRATPYFVGIMTGFIKYKMRHSTYKLPKILYISGWIINPLLIFVTVYMGHIFYLPQFTDDRTTNALYAGFHHFTISVGNAWVIIAVSSGKGSWIEPIFAWKPFMLLSRINYTAFLVHATTQMYTVGVMRQPNFTSYFAIIYSACADIVFAYIFGFLLSILIESPMIGIEKIIFGRTRDQKFLDTNTNGAVEEVKIINTQEKNTIDNAFFHLNKNEIIDESKITQTNNFIEEKK